MNDLRDQKAYKTKQVNCCNSGTSHPAKEDPGMEHSPWSASPLGGFGKQSMAYCGSHKNLAKYGPLVKKSNPCGKLEDRLHNFEQLFLRVMSKLDFSHCGQADQDDLSAALEAYIAGMSTKKEEDAAAREESIRAELREENQKILERGFEEAYEVVLEVRKALNEANALILLCAKHMALSKPGVPPELTSWLTKYAERFIPGPLTVDVSDPVKTLVKGV